MTVKSTQDENTVKKILKLTMGLLFILDQNKNNDYMLAIIMEYIEGIRECVTGITLTEDQLFQGSKEKGALQQICAQSREAIEQFIDPDQVDPALVTFWLQRTCNLQEIKCMDTMLLFLSKEQQQKILQYDKEFVQDPYLQLLKRCLPIY